MRLRDCASWDWGTGTWGVGRDVWKGLGEVRVYRKWPGDERCTVGVKRAGKEVGLVRAGVRVWGLGRNSPWAVVDYTTGFVIIGIRILHIQSLEFVCPSFSPCAIFEIITYLALRLLIFAFSLDLTLITGQERSLDLDS
nr:hypothetical protein [Tanacetum cinerariifolium]